MEPRTTSPADPGTRRRRPQGRVWLLGLIGTLAVVLPLLQVLRFQVDVLAEAQSERTWLDPLAEAVAVHRGLAAHDEAATGVLRGRVKLEAERRLRQAVVDRHLAALQGLLGVGGWREAQREASGIAGDWRQLVAQVEGRRIDAAASQRAHGLLQEQAVQVMDLVQASAPARLSLRDRSTLPQQVAAHQALIDQRAERARATVVLAGAALAAALAMALAMTAAALRRAGGAARSRPADDDVDVDAGVRRSHGRRAGDRPAATAPAERARAEIDHLRRAAEDERSGG